jgi:hypothetical protein
LLEPHAHSRRERQSAGHFTLRARMLARTAETLLPRRADARSEPAPQLVTQAQADFSVRQSGADAAQRVALAVRIRFPRRLQDHALHQARRVRKRDTCGGASAQPGCSVAPVSDQYGACLYCLMPGICA